MIALLVAGGADELSSFETERRVIPGGVSVRIYSRPGGHKGAVAGGWPDHGR